MREAIGLYNVTARQAFDRVITKLQGMLTSWAPTAGFARHIIVGQSDAIRVRNMVPMQVLDALDQRCKALFRALRLSRQPSSIKQPQNTGESGLIQTWQSSDGESFELCADGTMRFNAVQSLSKSEKQQRMEELPGSRNYDARFAHGNIMASLQTYTLGTGWKTTFPAAKALVDSFKPGESLFKKVFIHTLNGGSWSYGGSVWELLFSFCDDSYDLASELRQQLHEDALWSAFLEELKGYEAANGEGSVGRLCRSTMTAYIDHVIENATKLGFKVWSHEHDGVFCDVPPDTMLALQASANAALHVSLELREKPFA